ncbi:MAG: tRNA 5-methoxyuridine(34)/uridine 5-oxyacetic acid(34) synthase CmoB [Legionellaceae bacterium]|nr:tRNA 5-methoxyuridine(34)/uridine 5-oxyacetic acid(34) synthase CmoB [Legionellaceae bacterium]
MDPLHAYFDDFYQSIQPTELQSLATIIPQALDKRFATYRHGLLDEWLDTLERLPRLHAGRWDLQTGVSVLQEPMLSPQPQEALKQQLYSLRPWRKGPYHIHGVDIDTEWRSDWKWNRIKEAISPLQGRCVLDVGCGNGYHCWRMYGAGARLVVGIDPSQLFWIQFQAIKHFLGAHPVFLLPLGIEYLPRNFHHFDTVFSMGVFYHRKSPFEHLQHLRSLLRPGGELVLETLIIEGPANTVLVPADRYACMANVWFIPSVDSMQAWLARAGFQNISLVDVNQTSCAEQRSTEWMPFQSLSDFLDPLDQNKTREGYPAPLRAIFTAQA